MSDSSRFDQLLKMLELEPEDDFLNHALAMEYLSANKITEAISVLENLLRRNPGYLASYYQLGQALEKIGEIKKAIDTYRKGIDIATVQKNRKAQGELNEALLMLED